MKSYLGHVARPLRDLRQKIIENKIRLAEESCILLVAIKDIFWSDQEIDDADFRKAFRRGKHFPSTFSDDSLKLGSF